MGYTTNFDLYLVAYCLAFGVVGGVGYMVPIHHTWGWFPKHAGLTSGFIIGSVGLGSIIFDQIAIMLCNPNNVDAIDGVFPPEVTQNVPKFNKVICWILTPILLLVIILVFPAPSKEDQKTEEGKEQPSRDSEKINEETTDFLSDETMMMRELTYKEGIQTTQFWSLVGLQAVGLSKS